MVNAAGQQPCRTKADGARRAGVSGCGHAVGCSRQAAVFAAQLGRASSGATSHLAHHAQSRYRCADGSSVSVGDVYA